MDGNGIPLAIVVDGANRHDMKLLEATLEAQLLVPSDLEPETHRHMCLDKGYDYEEIRQILQQWGYVGHIPPKDDAKLIIQDIPNYRARRWVVERTHSWMNRQTPHFDSLGKERRQLFSHATVCLCVHYVSLR